MAGELTREQVDAMLHRLSTDEAYHTLFQQDPAAALSQLPGKPSMPPDMQAGACLRPVQLVSMEALAKTRDQLAEQWFSRQAQIPKILEE